MNTTPALTWDTTHMEAIASNASACWQQPVQKQAERVAVLGPAQEEANVQLREFCAFCHAQNFALVGQGCCTPLLMLAAEQGGAHTTRTDWLASPRSTHTCQADCLVQKRPVI